MISTSLRHLRQLVKNIPITTRTYHCFCGEKTRPQRSISLYSSRYLHTNEQEAEAFSSPVPRYDWQYLSDPKNKKEISENIENRKGIGNIALLQSLHKQLLNLEENEDPDNFLTESIQQTTPRDFLQDKEADIATLKQQLLDLASEIPNISHPDAPIGDESQAGLLATYGVNRNFPFTPKTVVELGENLNLLRTRYTGQTTGPRSYYFIGPLAQLEQALVHYVVDTLLAKGFELMTVPDLVHPTIIEGCGFKVSGKRTQVYKLDPSHFPPTCLAGTGEMPLAGYFMNNTLKENDLPTKIMTVSKCFRAEVSDLEEERGIYRVHQFNKVEMFGLTGPDTSSSSALMKEFSDIQIQLFSELGLHFRVLDMPSQELGPPAHRKYDMEAWMPARGFWGEISSTSNCTDYQSRRLNITYRNVAGRRNLCHTVNGTACAVPRMIMAIMESYQQEDGTVPIPSALHPYMSGCTILQPHKQPPMHWIKYKKKTTQKRT